MNALIRTPVRPKLDDFTQSYLECALGTCTDPEGRPLDESYGVGDLSHEAILEAVEHCRCFQADHADLIGGRAAEAGHDFWLTRNRHGAGFWDGDWPGPAGRILTEASHAWGSADLVIGADGRLFLF